VAELITDKIIIKMKNIKYLMITSLVTGMFASCLKPNKATYTNFSEVTDKVMIINSGVANAGKAPANILVAGSTDSFIAIDVDVQLASKNTNASDLTVKLGLDDAARVKYNTNDPNAVGFEALPDSCYSFPNGNVLIKSGTNFGKTTLYIYPTKVDVSKSYMLPISITDPGGKEVTTNANTQYFNVIGNELAGPYLWTFSRWNLPDTNGPKNGSSFVDESGLILPVTPTTISLTSGYYIQPRFNISYKKSGGVYSDWKITINPEDNAVLETNGVTVTDGPYIWVADPVNRKFVIAYQVFNGAANRFLIDDYHQ
jgi:hypothetical protein